MKNHYKYLIVILTVFILFLGFFVSKVSAQTVASDNFNTGISRWNNNGSAHPETFICGSTGCNSVKMACTASETTTPGSGCTVVGNGQLSQSFAVTKGATYQVTISAGVFTDGASPNGGVTLTITDGSQTRSSSCSNTSCTASGSSINGSLSVTITSQTTTLTVRLNGTQGGCSGTGCHDPYVDDFVITQTAAPPPEQLSVICSGAPNPATSGQEVTWTATPKGGIGNYSYSWSGDVSGTTNPIKQTYTNTGTTAITKTATIKVTSGTESKSASCSVTITAPGTDSIVTPPTVTRTSATAPWPAISIAVGVATTSTGNIYYKSGSGVTSGPCTGTVCQGWTLVKSGVSTSGSPYSWTPPSGTADGTYTFALFDQVAGKSVPTVSQILAVDTSLFSTTASPSPSGCTLTASPSTVAPSGVVTISLSGVAGTYNITCLQGNQFTASAGDTFQCSAPSQTGKYPVSAKGPGGVYCEATVTVEVECTRVVSNITAGPYVYTYKDTFWNNTNYNNATTGIPAQWPQYFFCPYDAQGNVNLAACTYGTATGNVSDAKRNDANFCGYTDLRIKTTWGNYSSLRLDSSGFPVISYYENNPLSSKKFHLVRCNDANCSGGDENFIEIDNSPDVGSYNSLALDSQDKAFISYYDAKNGDLKLASCTTSSCTVNIIDSKGDVGLDNSLALTSTGFPVISYYDATNKTLKLYFRQSGTYVSPDSKPNVGQFTSLALDSGLPVVSYQGPAELKILKCLSADCATYTITIADSATLSYNTSLTLDSAGFPVVSYYKNEGGLKILHCANADCTSKNNSKTSPTSLGNWSGTQSLVLDGKGYPVVSAAAGSLIVVHCNDPNCAKNDESVVSLGFWGDNPSLRLDSSGNPVVSYTHNISYQPSETRLLHCNDANCAGGDESIVSPGGKKQGVCRQAFFSWGGGSTTNNYDSAAPFNQPNFWSVQNLPNVTIHAAGQCGSYTAVTDSRGEVTTGEWRSDKTGQKGGLIGLVKDKAGNTTSIEYDIWAEVNSTGAFGRQFTRAAYLECGTSCSIYNGADEIKSPSDQPRFDDFKGYTQGHNFRFGFTNPGKEPVCTGMTTSPKAPILGERPLTVSFTDGKGTDDGKIVAYGWDFDGDGILDQETQANSTTHIYNKPGFYNAQLFVKDDIGLYSFSTSACQAKIAVACANFTLTPSSVTMSPGETKILTASKYNTQDSNLIRWSSSDPAVVSVTGTICTAAPSSESNQEQGMLEIFVGFVRKLISLVLATHSPPQCSTGDVPGGTTGSLYGHKEGTVNITAVDPGDTGSCLEGIKTVKVDVVTFPWIQTTGGDVHSNIKISTPGGP